MALQSATSKEPIPGYTVVERLGAGGYGEVWKAIAPGSIEKAIKFVYGYHDDDRAARELKALNRIKEVRHPFLLSLDRIEVVDGQLVIVTELADESLKDHFLACQHSGSSGIPREELLVYLRDAADALDYMSDQCGLQHLDVKPENLLLLGGRVKVADFGLVRDIREVSASMAGGLTPIYAPPEAFEGHPGLRSDQYSLAIVYQEMLTATLPFSGSTPAQLMAQHLQDRPNVSVLPRSDQPAIARALSKAPNDRFPSCRAMVESLRAATSARFSAPRAKAKAKAKARPEQVVDAQEDANADRGGTLAPSPGAGAGGRGSDSRHHTVARESALIETAAEVAELPPLDLEDAEIELRPTLFLGLGGTGARVLRRLRRRLHDRFGGLAKVPALRMLLIDTDLKCTLRATDGENGEALSPQETVAIPLRRAQEFRNHSSELLLWLSRRWLYNIPRSRQPEGRRPLGRLAFVDHAERVMQRLRSVLTEMAAPEAINESIKTTGRPFSATTPRVFLVASISGGTGGGIVLDVAYAVRKILVELGLSDDGVRGILTHSTGHGEDARDLAIANAYACLSELRHYSHASLRYPGASECDLPPFAADDHTFPETYLVRLGDNLGAEEFDAATDQIAEYLYLDAATAAGTLLDKCRHEPGGPALRDGASGQLRSFALCQLGRCLADIPPRIEDLLCLTIAQRWSCEPSPHHAEAVTDTIGTGAAATDTVDTSQGPAPPADSPAGAAVQQDDDKPLDLPSLLRQMTDRAEQQLGSDAAGLCHNLRAKATQDPGDLEGEARAAATAAQLVASIDAALADDALWRPRDAAQDTIAEPDEDEELDELAAARAEPARHAILGLLDTPGARIIAACQVTAQWRTGQRQAKEQAGRAIEQTRRQVAALAAELCEPDQTSRTAKRRHRPPAAANDDETLLIGYAEQKLALAATVRAEQVLDRIGAELSRFEVQLQDLRRDLNHLQTPFESDPLDVERKRKSTSPAGPKDQLRYWMMAALKQRLPQLATDLEQQLDSKIREQYGGFYGFFATGGNFRQRLLDLLKAEAGAAVRRAIDEIHLADGVLQVCAASADADLPVQSWIKTATPDLLACGGARRLLLVAKKGTASESLQALIEQETQQGCSTACDSDCDVVLCCEAEQIGYEAAATHLIGNRIRYAEIGARLHTRIDVAWTSLTQLE